MRGGTALLLPAAVLSVVSGVVGRAVPGLVVAAAALLAGCAADKPVPTPLEVVTPRIAG